MCFKNEKRRKPDNKNMTLIHCLIIMNNTTNLTLQERLTPIGLQRIWDVSVLQDVSSITFVCLGIHRSNYRGFLSTTATHEHLNAALFRIFITF
jgi:hypothetical protein